jgi:hypothetical protein
MTAAPRFQRTRVEIVPRRRSASAGHAELLANGSAMATALQRDCRWMWHRS